MEIKKKYQERKEETNIENYEMNKKVNRIWKKQIS